MGKQLKESILHIRFEKTFQNTQEIIYADCELHSAKFGSYTCTFTPKTSLQNVSEFVVDLFNSSTLSTNSLFLQINDQEIEVKKLGPTTDNASEYYFKHIVSSLRV